MSALIRFEITDSCKDLFIERITPLLDPDDAVAVTADLDGLKLDVSIADPARYAQILEVGRTIGISRTSAMIASFENQLVSQVASAVLEKTTSLSVTRAATFTRLFRQDPKTKKEQKLGCGEIKVAAHGEGVGSGDGPGPFTPGAPSATKVAARNAEADAIEKALAAQRPFQCADPCWPKWRVSLGSVVNGKVSYGPGYTTKFGTMVRGREHVEGSVVPWELRYECVEHSLAGEIGPLDEDLSETTCKCAGGWTRWGCARVRRTVSSHTKYDHSKDDAAADDAAEIAIAAAKQTLANRPHCPSECPIERVSVDFWCVIVEMTETYDTHALWEPYDVNIDAKAAWEVSVRCLALY